MKGFPFCHHTSFGWHLSGDGSYIIYDFFWKFCNHQNHTTNQIWKYVETWYILITISKQYLEVIGATTSPCVIVVHCGLLFDNIFGLSHWLFSVNLECTVQNFLCQPSVTYIILKESLQFTRKLRSCLFNCLNKKVTKPIENLVKP